MNWSQDRRAIRSAPAWLGVAHRPATAWAALVLCVAAAGCMAESTPEELGAVQYKGGQPLTGFNPTASPIPGATEGPAESAAPDAMPVDPAPSSNDMAEPPANAAPPPAQPDTPPASDEMDPTLPESPAPNVDPQPVAGGGAPPATEPSGPSEPSGPAEPSGTAEAGMLTVAFMSVGPGGRYAPRNCGAVWIEDENGKFIKTIERWTAIRERYLQSWSRASGGWGFSFFGTSNNPDQVDAVTSGTLSRHQMHMSTWNMKNVEGDVVPDGKYSVVVEVSEGSPGVGRIDFVKGPMDQTLTGDAPVFSNMTVTYTR